MEPESDLEEPILRTEPEGVGDHVTPLNATQEATPRTWKLQPPPPPKKKSATAFDLCM